MTLVSLYALGFLATIISIIAIGTFTGILKIKNKDDEDIASMWITLAAIGWPITGPAFAAYALCRVTLEFCIRIKHRLNDNKSVVKRTPESTQPYR